MNDQKEKIKFKILNCDTLRALSREDFLILDCQKVKNIGFFLKLTENKKVAFTNVTVDFLDRIKELPNQNKEILVLINAEDALMMRACFKVSVGHQKKKYANLYIKDSYMREWYYENLKKGLVYPTHINLYAKTVYADDIYKIYQQ